MIGEQAIFNLDIKKKSGLSINPDIHHSKVFSSGHNYKKKFKLLDPHRKSLINYTINRIVRVSTFIPLFSFLYIL